MSIKVWQRSESYQYKIINLYDFISDQYSVNIIIITWENRSDSTWSGPRDKLLPERRDFGKRSPRVFIPIIRLALYRLRLPEKRGSTCRRKFREIQGGASCKVILPTTSFLRCERGSDDQFEVGDDRRGKGSSSLPDLPPSCDSSSPLTFIISSAPRAWTSLLHDTCRPPVNILHKIPSLSLTDSFVSRDKIATRSSKYT